MRAVTAVERPVAMPADSWSLRALSALVLSSALACSGEPEPQTKTPIPQPVVASPADAAVKLSNAPKLSPHVVEGIEIGQYGGTLVLAAAGDPKTFNPLLGNESSSNLVLRPMFADCWAFHNGRQEEEPGLCESYVRSEDGLTYTFTLREGLRWSDGHPMTSDDFEFSYRAVCDPKIPNSDRDLFRQGLDAQGKPRYPRFEKLDDRRFRFVLHERDVLFHYTAGSYAVIPKHVWASAYRAGRLSETMSVKMNLDRLVGSGPFVVREYQPGKRIIMKRNEHYWKVDPKGNRLPYLDAVEFVVLPDQSATVAYFQSGETDLNDVRAPDYERLKRAEKVSNSVVVDLGPSFNTNYLMFNLDTRSGPGDKPYVDPIKLKWFQKKKFRAAISHAIDRDTIVRNVLHGRGQPLWAYTSPANLKWHPKNVFKYPYSLDKAAQLLEEEGFKKVDGRLQDADGNPVKFSIKTNAESATRIGMLNLIKQDLDRLGIVADIRPTPFNDIISALRQTRDFDALLLGWGTSVPPDPTFSRNVILSSGHSHAWNPDQVKPATTWEAQMDELLSKNTSTPEYKARKSYSDQLFRIFSDYQPQIQLVVVNDAAAARSNVGNFQPSALRPRTHWNIETLYFKTPKKAQQGP